MASIVFFRAVNVGSHQRFQPGKLAEELAEFDVVNIGAAGTFVVRARVAQRMLRDAINQRLPFKPELMICPASDLVALLSEGIFPPAPPGKDAQKFLTVLGGKPDGKAPKLPIVRPAEGAWEVQVVKMIGQFVLSYRRLGADTYSNAVVEKEFKAPATTRNWNTVETIARRLERK